MGIPISSNFNLGTAIPIDSRMVVADTTARDAIASGVRYDGLLVYVLADNKNYQLQGGITNGDWVELAGSATVPYATKSSSVDAGSLGELSVDDDYLYICVVAGAAGFATWKKIGLTQT